MLENVPMLTNGTIHTVDTFQQHICFQTVSDVIRQTFAIAVNNDKYVSNLSLIKAVKIVLCYGTAD